MNIIWHPSPNFNDRPVGAKINWIILHYTALENTETSLTWMCDPAKEVSAHYLICRTGKIYQLVEDQKRAWHAGVSHWKGEDNLNNTSIGIELDNNGTEPYTDIQIQALLKHLDYLCEKHKIPRSHILGHSDIAPDRKIDPGTHFPWDALYQHGFGLVRSYPSRG